MNCFSNGQEGLKFSFTNWNYEDIYGLLSQHRMGDFYFCPSDCYSHIYVLNLMRATGFTIGQMEGSKLEELVMTQKVQTKKTMDTDL